MKKMLFVMVVLCAAMIFTAAFGQAEKDGEKPAVGLANPWVETDPDGLMQTLGLQFEVPEGAEDVVYRMNESAKLAEMQFTLNGVPLTARIKPAGTEIEDISGMYYDWEYEEMAKGPYARRWFQEKMMAAHDGEDTVEVYLWFDMVPGLTYSLSAKAPDLDGFDIIAVAEAVYHKTQGDA